MNVNGMEVFVLGREKRNNRPFSFLVISNRFNKSSKTLGKLYKRYKTLKIEESDYRAAGPDQIILNFRDLNELESVLLTETEIVMAIKEMNLRLMRKGGTIYSPYHCFDLVNDIVG